MCKFKFKHKGLLLLSAIIMSFVFISITTAYILTVSTNLQSVKANGDMLQARRYADIKKNEILLYKYDDLQKIKNGWSDFEFDKYWEYRINVSNEKINVVDGEKYKIATIYMKNKSQDIESFETMFPIYKNSSSASDENDGAVSLEENIITLDNENSLTFKKPGFVVYNMKKCSRAIVKEESGREYIIPDSTIYPVAENEKFILQGCSPLTNEEKNIVFFTFK